MKPIRFSKHYRFNIILYVRALHQHRGGEVLSFRPPKASVPTGLKDRRQHCCLRKFYIAVLDHPVYISFIEPQGAAPFMVPEQSHVPVTVYASTAHLKQGHQVGKSVPYFIKRKIFRPQWNHLFLFGFFHGLPACGSCLMFLLSHVLDLIGKNGFLVKCQNILNNRKIYFYTCFK